MQQCLPFTVLKHSDLKILKVTYQLQQCLPFTVLKLQSSYAYEIAEVVATVLTVYGIETKHLHVLMAREPCLVATVLTVYGIETNENNPNYFEVRSWLQQCLPFTVLKLIVIASAVLASLVLQQCLPFTVLKLNYFS